MLEVECEGNRPGRREGRATYRQKNVVSCMSKSLVGVGDPKLGTKDSNVILFFYNV